MRKRPGDFLPLILVVVGLGILLYPTVSNFLVERNASRVISNYDAAVANLTEEEYVQMLDDAHAYNSKVAALAGVQPIDGSIDVSGISAETLRQEHNGLLNLNGDGMMGFSPSQALMSPCRSITRWKSLCCRWARAMWKQVRCR